MNKKLLIIIGSVLGLGILFFIGTKAFEKNKVQELKTVDSSVFVRDHSPRLGREGAPVQVVEFLDPECESCREFYPYTKMLLEEFEGKVELVVRYAPFHGNSIMAVKILEGARKQNRYWETLEVLFQYQPQWGSHHHPRPDLMWKYIEEVPGLNIAEIRKQMDDPKVASMIEQDIADSKTLNVRATPTFFINGVPLKQFSYEALKQDVEAALSGK